MRAERCDWSAGAQGVKTMLGVSLRARRYTTHVMLGLSLWARWDTTLVFNNAICSNISMSNKIVIKYWLEEMPYVQARLITTEREEDNRN